MPYLGLLDQRVSQDCNQDIDWAAIILGIGRGKICF